MQAEGPAGRKTLAQQRQDERNPAYSEQAYGLRSEHGRSVWLSRSSPLAPYSIVITAEPMRIGRQNSEPTIWNISAIQVWRWRRDTHG